MNKILEVKNVSKKFFDGDTDIIALDDINMEIDEGQFIALNGPSGSGKSTLLSIIGGLQKPTTGTVLLGGTNIYSLNDKKLSDLRNRELGFILQSSNLIPFLTVKEQFVLQAKYQHKKFDKEYFNEITKVLGIEKLINKYPNEISGGEKQRVAIGICLYNRPKIILADEPTASLDTKKAYTVVELLQESAKKFNTTIIMVTHDLRMLEYCDKVYSITDGKISE